MTGTRAVIAAWGALLLGVTACSGSAPEPHVAAPSSSAPSSPSTSPAATGSASPTDAQAQDAALDEFFLALTQGLATGDASRFLALASPSCVNCKVLAANLKKAYANGGHIEGADWSVSSSDFKRQAPLGWIWNVDVESAQERWYDGSGTLVKIVKAGTQEFGIALESDGARWLVRELRLRQT